MRSEATVKVVLKRSTVVERRKRERARLIVVLPHHALLNGHCPEIEDTMYILASVSICHGWGTIASQWVIFWMALSFGMSVQNR